MKSLLTDKQLAERLQISHWTVREWRRTGRIPAVVVSPKVIRFDYEDVVEALLRPESKTGQSDHHEPAD